MSRLAATGFLAASSIIDRAIASFFVAVCVGEAAAHRFLCVDARQLILLFVARRVCDKGHSSRSHAQNKKFLGRSIRHARKRPLPPKALFQFGWMLVGLYYRFVCFIKRWPLCSKIDSSGILACLRYDVLHHKKPPRTIRR